MSSVVRSYHWLYLLGAIIFEVIGTTVMKVSQSWSIPHAIPLGIIAMLALIALSYYLLSLATIRLPVGVAFACWEGVGLSLITLVSVLILGEHMNMQRFAALCAVLSGVMLIHHGTEAHSAAKA
ncbi:MAG: multidrug efflux SMR transporter [Desulfovibrionaceae bacterium]